MIDTIKTKLNQAWNWIKRKVKAILIWVGIIGIATAATIIDLNKDEIPFIEVQQNVEKILQLHKPSWAEGIKDKYGNPLGLNIFSEYTYFEISNTIEKKIEVKDIDLETGEEIETITEAWIPVWVYDVETINEKKLEQTELFAGKIDVQFIIKPNELTYIIREGRIADFNANYRFKGREITQEEFDGLIDDLTEIPVSQLKGSLEDTKTRVVSSSGKTGYDWIDNGKSDLITLIATTIKETKANGGYQQIAQTKLGKHSITFTYRGSSVTYGTVTSDTDPARTWLDKNLGATDVATAYNDSSAYGHLFQWGRLDDGHQLRNSGTTQTQSDTDDPGHSNFIYGSDDWRNPANDDLWNSPDYTNLIASAKSQGYRVPTETELNTERLSWSSNDRDGAYASPLKLTTGGYFYYNDAELYYVGERGKYWSSTVDTTDARSLFFYRVGAYMRSEGRANGFSVRLIYDASLDEAEPTAAEIEMSVIIIQ